MAGEDAAVREPVDAFYTAATGITETIEGMKTARSYAPDHPVYENGFTDEQRQQVRKEAEEVATAWAEAYDTVYTRADAVFNADHPVQALVHATESFRTGFDEGYPADVHPYAAEMRAPAYTINGYVDAEHILLGVGRRTGCVKQMADAFDVAVDTFITDERLAGRVAPYTGVTSSYSLVSRD